MINRLQTYFVFFILVLFLLITFALSPLTTLLNSHGMVAMLLIIMAAAILAGILESFTRRPPTR